MNVDVFRATRHTGINHDEAILVSASSCAWLQVFPDKGEAKIAAETYGETPFTLTMLNSENPRGPEVTLPLGTERSFGSGTPNF